MNKSRIPLEMQKLIEDPPPTPFYWRRFCCGKTQMGLQVETKPTVLQSRISAFERGQLTPRRWEREALAKALDIDADKLMFPCDYDDQA